MPIAQTFFSNPNHIGKSMQHAPKVSFNPFPTPPSTSSEGIWTLQTHPKHLLRRYNWRPRVKLEPLLASPSQLAPLKDPEWLTPKLQGFFRDIPVSSHSFAHTWTLQGVSNGLPHTTYRLPDRAPRQEGPGSANTSFLYNGGFGQEGKKKALGASGARD